MKNNIDDWGELYKDLEPLHEKHLEILLYLRDFCRELGIEMCLAYGSALGALRHGGPIPWDDDSDVAMRSEDYERFRAAFKSRGDTKRFYLQEVLDVQGRIEFAKLRLNNTCFIEGGMEGFDMHQGIYTDIFLLHPAPKGAGLIMGRLSGYYVELERMALQHYRGRRAALPLMALLRALPERPLLKRAMRLMYAHDKKPSDRLVSWGIPFRIYERDMIFPARDCEYDGHMLPVPGRAEDYLKYVYGQWRVPPANKKIHAAVWSAQEDFRKYAFNIKSFADEIHIK